MFQKRDKILGIMAVLLGTGIFFESSRWVQLVDSDPAGPAGAPKLLAAGIIFLGIVLFIGSFFADQEKQEGTYLDRTVVSIFLLCITYVLFLQVVGYLIMTPILIGGVMWLLLTRNIKEILLISLTSTFVLYTFFHFFLKVKFPLGIIRGVINGI